MSKKYKGVINLDLDGVVDDWHQAMFRWLQDNRVIPMNRKYVEPSQWNFFQDWGLSVGEFKRWWRLGVDLNVIWVRDLVIPGVRSYLWELSDDDWYIRVVTARLVHSFSHAKIIGNTTEWLDREAIPYREIVFQGPGTDKFEFVCDVAVDDNLEIANGYADAGVQSYLITKPWNAGPTEALRVDTFKEFYDAITKTET